MHQQCSILKGKKTFERLSHGIGKSLHGGKDGLEKMLFKPKLKIYCTSLSLCHLHASGIKFFSKTDAFIFKPETKWNLLYFWTDLRQIENNVTGKIMLEARKFEFTINSENFLL
jgi:hypothetical protein